MKITGESLRNFWYYNKIYIIVGILSLSLIVYSFVSSAKVDDGCNRYCAVISPEPFSEEQLAELKTALDDWTGDRFGVRYYRIALGELNQDDAILAKLDIDLSHKLSTYIFVEDPALFAESTDDLSVSEQGRADALEGFSCPEPFAGMILLTRK